MILCPSKDQGRIAMGYCEGIFDHPKLRHLVKSRTKSSITLHNRTKIEIVTASQRVTKGFSVIFLGLDELAMFRSDGERYENPDSEVIAAIIPAMATFKDALIFVASNPHSPTGELHRMHSESYGNEDDARTLVWSMDTKSMNDTIPQHVIDEAFERDPSKAWSDYGRDGEIRFRADLESYVSAAVVKASVIEGRFELPYEPGIEHKGFVDVASGSGRDSWVTNVGRLNHDTKQIEICAILETRPPFSPEETVKIHTEFLQSYGIDQVMGDAYAAGFSSDAHLRNGMRYYERCPANKTQLYRDLLPVLNSGCIDLLDNPRLISQLLGLERRTGHGPETIDHVRGAHDDIVNAVAGLVYHLLNRGPRAPRKRAIRWG